MASIFEDLTGKRFGKLTVICFCEVKNHRRIWTCKCDCGNTKNIREDSLKKYTRSCGCALIEAVKKNKNNLTHGKSRSRIYKIWGGMKARCNNPQNKSYVYYGAREIKVCDEWQSFEAFYDWAMSNGYSDELSIDRIDVDGDYEPLNCRWANAHEQRVNQRVIEITFNGETHNLYEWSEITGIKYATLIWRYHQNWTPEKILENVDHSIDTRFKTSL